MLKKFYCILFITSLFPIYSQGSNFSTISNNVPPAPVVSDLSARVQDSEVVLTWSPSSVDTSYYVILRSTQPITASNFTQSERIALVPSSQTEFTDKLKTNQTYYYAVLIQASNNSEYTFFIPLYNSLLVGVSSQISQEQIEPAIFKSFDYFIRNDSVILAWQLEKSAKKLFLYRSTSPFTDFNSLTQAVLIATFTNEAGAPYLDYPVPGVPYYYALVDEYVIRLGTTKFTPNINTNREPIEISRDFSRFQRTLLPSLRPIPLPWLNINQTITTNPQKFSKSTESIISSLIHKNETLTEIIYSPTVLKEESQLVSSGEEYTFRSILQNTFFKNNWEEAEKELLNYLTLRRSTNITARTKFYLGQAYFFQKKYEKALLEFLICQDSYYNESQEWIQYSLKKIIETSKN